MLRFVTLSRALALAFVLMSPLMLPLIAQADQRGKAENSDISRGRYLATIAGCNDCHTPNYPETAGKVPESAWLTGNAVGWKGPWGVSYPANLRLSVQQHSEDGWIALASSPLRPPMPWFNLREMAEPDKRALYRFIRSLGPAGQAAPLALPPGAVASTPVISFE